MLLLRSIVRHVVQGVATNPRTREKAIKVARGVVKEARQVAEKDDPAHAAGRAVRRALNKLQSGR